MLPEFNGFRSVGSSRIFTTNKMLFRYTKSRFYPRHLLENIRFQNYMKFLMINSEATLIMETTGSYNTLVTTTTSLPRRPQRTFSFPWTFQISHELFIVRWHARLATSLTYGCSAWVRAGPRPFLVAEECPDRWWRGRRANRTSPEADGVRARRTSQPAARGGTFQGRHPQDVGGRAQQHTATGSGVPRTARGTSATVISGSTKRGSFSIQPFTSQKRFLSSRVRNVHK
jgi:hypothetical protein